MQTRSLKAQDCCLFDEPDLQAIRRFLPARRQLLQQHQPLGAHLDVAAFFQVFEQSADQLAGGADAAGYFLVGDGFECDTAVCVPANHIEQRRVAHRFGRHANVANDLNSAPGPRTGLLPAISGHTFKTTTFPSVNSLSRVLVPVLFAPAPEPRRSMNCHAAPARSANVS